MRLAIVTRRSDKQRLASHEPDAYVLLDPVEIDGKRLLPEELKDVLFLPDAPFGILDGFQGSMELRELALSSDKRYVIFSKYPFSGSVKIDDKIFVNASLGAIIDGDRVITPVRRGKALKHLAADTPRGLPQVDEPIRLRAYKEFEDPHTRRIAMFARAYLEGRPIIFEPLSRKKLEEFLSLERPVFFDLEFDARALRKNFEPKPEEPIIRVASFHDGRLHRYFIRTADEERRFLEHLAEFDSIVGYGTHGDLKILRKAAERYGIEVPKVIDLREFIFPKDPKEQRIALPVGRKTGLKAVAEALGFRRSSDKDGYRAFKAYLKARRLGRPRRIVRELVDYNAEDTQMTKYVFLKLRRLLDRVKG